MPVSFFSHYQKAVQEADTSISVQVKNALEKVDKHPAMDEAKIILCEAAVKELEKIVTPVKKQLSTATDSAVKTKLGKFIGALMQIEKGLGIVEKNARAAVVRRDKAVALERKEEEAKKKEEEAEKEAEEASDDTLEAIVKSKFVPTYKTLVKGVALEPRPAVVATLDKLSKNKKVSDIKKLALVAYQTLTKYHFEMLMVIKNEQANDRKTKLTKFTVTLRKRITSKIKEYAGK